MLITFGAVFIGLCACSKSKSSSEYPKDPKGVLSAFLEADSQAAALSPQTWPDLARYTTWHDAPKWDKFTIVDRIEIGDIRTGSTRAQITVTYHDLGVMSASSFASHPAPEDVVFYINQVNGQWKVDLPQIMPHVSWPVFQKRLNDASATDPKMKAANDALINQIAAAAQQPH